MSTITIDGKEIGFEPGETVLRAARRAGIRIPHLCSLDGVEASPAASCRVCVVEVQGMPRLQTSCTLQARDGMVVQTHSPRVQRIRRNIVELLLASHPDDCLYCPKGPSCELAALAGELGVRERRYTGIRKSHPLDLSSPSLVRDANKCILCGRCVTVCHRQQKVGAIDFAGRGFATRVDPAYHEGLNVSGCVFCGQCVRVCPTAALTEKSSVERVVAALGDPRCVVVAQVAPAVPATLLEGAAQGTIPAMLETLAGALRRVGFAAVFDTSFAADLTIWEEAAELVRRVEQGGPLPMFTSCSPAWVRYVELHRPELIPHLSTCKSPQQMAGALIKELYPRRVDLGGRRLFLVSLMPCTAKKAEAHELGDVDAVLTTRELSDLLRRFGVSLAEPGLAAPLDAPFSEATGAGRIFGGTGGVMEAALRTAYRLLTGEELKDGPKVADARGLRGMKLLAVPVAGQELRCAVVNGLGEAASLLDAVAQGRSDLTFVEVMSCPGGCVGGGGQPYGTDAEAVRRRLERLYEVDRRSTKRMSHDNAQVQALYRDVLGAPLGPESHRLLHRHYVDRREG